MEIEQVAAELGRALRRIEALERKAGLSRSAALLRSLPDEARWHTLGVDFERGEPLLASRSEGAFVEGLAGLIGGLAGRDLPRFDAGGLRGAVESFAPSVNLNNPRLAGWTWLCAADDPQRSAYEELVAPLARHRGMARPAEPLLYSPEVELAEWIEDHLDGPEAPHYVLIVGGPEQVPFWFQAALAGRARVGRLEHEVLGAVVEKILRIEQQAQPVPGREIAVFAPDDDPATAQTRRGLAEPLVQDAARSGWTTRALLGEDATSERLLDVLTGRPLAVAFLTGHGVAERRSDEANRREINGALRCAAPNPLARPEVLAASALPLDLPLVEGGVVVQLSCFSYGTPAQSEYAHWTGDGTQRWATSDFVAAWPRRLLAHPRGPLAFVGHLDLTWVRTFQDPDPRRSASRSRPLREVQRQLLECVPVGQSMADVHARYHDANGRITRLLEAWRRAGGEGSLDDPELIHTWVARNDARNFLVYGDPACRVWRPS
jgi:hypothetical protein